jgi:iron complex outermembrane recepter protein
MNRSRSMSRLHRLNVTPRPYGLRHLALRRAPLASAISAVLASAAPGAYAATATASDTADTSSQLEEVVVTAQKVTENLQNVPISIETLGSQKLEQLNIGNIDDYVTYLPGVTTVKGLGQGGNAVGTTHMYMRGVVSGQDGNHSASQPSVGTYLDEQPVTTIDGTVDMHIYDIARIEVLEGPQGTLYGASSEAGTIRIITNKPDPSKFAAGYDIAGDAIYNGGQGWQAEGFVNIPILENMAVRIVAWDTHTPGYISNVAGTEPGAGIGPGANTAIGLPAGCAVAPGQRVFPVWSATQCAAGLPYTLNYSPNGDYNTSETRGGRAALKWDLGDWTVSPTFMGQALAANGFFGYDPAVGPLEVTHFGPENLQDSFTQSALTVEGKVSDFDIVYSGGWFTRNTHSIADYADYSYFYDKYYGSGCNWLTQAGATAVKNGATSCSGSKIYGGTPLLPAADYTEPQEFVITRGHYTKWSQELRVSTPAEYPVHGTVGVFAQRQVHEIWEQYTMPGLNGNPYTTNPQGLAPSLTVPGISGNTIWLTDEERVDRDEAEFAQVSWDITSQWELTGGFRQFHYDNSLQGFYGYSAPYATLIGAFPGQNACGPNGQNAGNGTPNFNYAPFHFAPCTDLNSEVSDNGHTELGRLTYKIDPNHLVYATYSTGFRPGGVNRVYDPPIHAVYPPYQADYLKNYEVGWKTQWAGAFRWNGALFWDEWNNFQFTFLGPNSVSVVQNAPNARIKGVETNGEWRPGGGWTINGSATFIDAKLTGNVCGGAYPAGTTNCPGPNSVFADGSVVNGPLAPSGSRLPVTPRFKADLLARYDFTVGDFDAHGQVAYVYQDSSVPLLYPVFYQNGYGNAGPHLGEVPPYSRVDLMAGAGRNGKQLEFLVDNVFNSLGEIGRFAALTPTTANQPYVVPIQPRTFWLKFGQKF